MLDMDECVSGLMVSILLVSCVNIVLGVVSRCGIYVGGIGVSLVGWMFVWDSSWSVFICVSVR